MARICKIFMVIALALVLGACTVRTADDGTGSVSDGNSVGIENPFINGGEQDDDDIIVSEGGGSGGSVSPAPATPQYDPLEITTNKLEACYQNKPYYQKLEGHGGSEHHEWTVTGLPPGLELSTKRIVGTTTANPGNYTVTVTLKDTETEESVTKQFSLKVIHFIVEDIKIRVSEMKGTTPLEVSASDSKVTSATLYGEAFRLKLEVLKHDGSPASAPRFHWWFTSIDPRLGLVVSPAEKDNENIKDGAIAYLMPWTRKGSLKQQALNIFESEDGLQDIEVNVRDDFGNTATIKFGKIEIEESQFIKCNALEEDEKLRITFLGNYNSEKGATDFSTNKFRDDSADKTANTYLLAEGGVPPYKWSFGEVVNEGAHAETIATKCFPNLGTPDCDKQILWTGIMLNSAHYPAAEFFSSIPVKLTDACGTTVREDAKLRIYFPNDPIEELRVTSNILDTCQGRYPGDVLDFSFLQGGPGYAGGDYVATGRYSLSSIPCSTSEGGSYLDWSNGGMTINEGMEKRQVLGIDAVEVHVRDTGGDPAYVDLVNAHFWSPNWEAWWHDPNNILNDDTDGNVMDVDITAEVGPGVKGLWSPNYANIPAEYLL